MNTKRRPRRASREKTSTFAFVTLELYPTTVGGTGILLHHTITALLRKHHRVVLYLDLNEEEIRKFEQRDRYTYPNAELLSFYDVRTMSHSLDFCRSVYDDTEQFRSVSIAHALLQTQDRHDIDLIEFYDYCGPAYHYLSFNAEKRRPTAIRLHNTTELIERGTRSRFNKERLFTFAMERAQLVMADLVLSPGPSYLKEEVQKLYGLELKNQRVALAPPIHASIGAVGYNAESRRILFYGRLSTFKGLDTFVNAAVVALTDPAFAAWLQEFVIVGPEETVASALTLDEIKSVIPAAVSAKFRFVGRVTHKRLLEVLGNVSFACFANRMESFCYAAHELRTAGIPVILADRPAFRDHFAAEDAIFFDTSVSGLANAMIALSADPERRVALSTRGLAKTQSDGAELYVGFAAQAAEQRAKRLSPPSGIARNTLTAFVVSNGDLEAEAATLASLSDGEISIYVLRLDERGEISFAGLRWSLGRDNDLFGKIAPAYLFVRAGDVCRPEALLEAARHIEADDRIGAIAPWCEVEGRVRSAPHAFVPEYAPMMGPGLRTLIRANPGATVIELLRSNSFSDECSSLLAQRAASRGLVEKPVVGLSVGGGVYLPPVQSESGVDYDRMSPIYLALSHGLPLSAGSGGRQPAMQAKSDRSGHHLVSIRPIGTWGEGELWVLRVFGQRGAMHEPWSATLRLGDWALVNDSHSPAGGALKTHSGELCFWADQGYGVEFLFGNFCGGVEIRWRDSVYHLRLKNEQVVSSIVWLDELSRGLFQPPLAGRAPIRAVGSFALADEAKAWIGTNIKADTSDLFLTPNPMSIATLSRQVSVAPSVLAGGQHYTSGDIVLALLAAIRKAKHCVVNLPFDLPRGPEIADLVMQGTSNPIVVDVDDHVTIGGGPGIYRMLANWIGLVDKHRDKLRFVGSNDDLLFSLQETGAQITRRKYHLPACPAVSTGISNDADIVILQSDGLIDNVAHMIAGAAFLRSLSVKVSTIFLSENQQHAALICETLSAARTFATYQSIEHVIALPRRRPLIACAVYPDPMIPVLAAKALALGTPTLLGPIGQTERFRNALGDMSVAFWEDSQDIGNALARLVTEQDTIIRGYNEAVAKQV